MLLPTRYYGYCVHRISANVYQLVCVLFHLQEGFGRLITSGKIMRKLPQEFAFPLGLGSKKVQSSNVTHDAKTNNNNSLRDNNKNPSMDVADDTSTTLNDALTIQDPLQQSNDGLSPRAPCQDLDTINL